MKKYGFLYKESFRGSYHHPVSKNFKTQPYIIYFSFYHTRDNHKDNISGIRTRAIEIVSICKIDFGKGYGLLTLRVQSLNI